MRESSGAAAMSLQEDSAAVSIFSTHSKKKRKQQRANPVPAKRRSSSAVAERRRRATTPELAEEGSDGDGAGGSGVAGARTFRDVGLNAWLSSVCTSLGMKETTPVQSACISKILQGRDVVACAETGSGKTACFLLPALQMLARDRFGVFCLVLVPARELAYQALEQLRGLGGNVVGMTGVAIVGGMSVTEQCRELAKKPHFVFATPGRLKDILMHDSTCAVAFKRLQMFVIDEADRILDPSFEEDLKVIGQYLPTKRQTLLFSATISQSIEILQEHVMKNCFKWSQHDKFKPVERITDQYVLPFCYSPATPPLPPPRTHTPLCLFGE